MIVRFDMEAVRRIAARAGQAVLDRLSTGLIDAPQDELVAGTAEAIFREFREALEPWAHTWDI